jgi:hypothetical protein
MGQTKTRADSRRFALVLVLSVACKPPAKTVEPSQQTRSKAPHPVSTFPVACPVICSGVRKLRTCEALPDDVWDAGELARVIDFKNPEDGRTICEDGVEVLAPLEARPPLDPPRPTLVITIRGRFSLSFRAEAPDASCHEEIVDIWDPDIPASDVVTVCQKAEAYPERKQFYSPAATQEAMESLSLAFVQDIVDDSGAQFTPQCHLGRVTQQIHAKDPNEDFSITLTDPNAPAPGIKDGRGVTPDTCCSFDDEGAELLLRGRVSEGQVQVTDMCRIR